MKAIYEIEPIGVNGAMEANGRVYYFCSEACCASFASTAMLRADHYIGDSDDAILGSVCDLCGKVLD